MIQEKRRECVGLKGPATAQLAATLQTLLQNTYSERVKVKTRYICTE